MSAGRENPEDLGEGRAEGLAGQVLKGEESERSLGRRSTDGEAFEVAGCNRSFLPGEAQHAERGVEADGWAEGGEKPSRSATEIDDQPLSDPSTEGLSQHSRFAVGPTLAATRSGPRLGALVVDSDGWPMHRLNGRPATVFCREIGLT